MYHTEISFEELLNVNNELETGNLMTNDEIVSNINAEISDEKIEVLQDQKEHEKKMTVKKADETIDRLRSFLESNENIKTEAFSNIAILKESV